MNLSDMLTDIHNNVIYMAIEKSLLKMGTIELDMVTSKLNKDFGMTLSNCLERPEALKQILCDLFSNSYTDILKSIDETLKPITMNDELYNFVRVLKS